MLNIGQQLRKARKKSNLTLDQLAASSGVDRGTISRIELGHVSPRIDTIGFLCEAMDTSLSHFFGLPEPSLTPEDKHGLPQAAGADGTPSNGLEPGSLTADFQAGTGGLPMPPAQGYWPVPSAFWRGLLEVLERFEILVKNSREMIMVKDRADHLLYVSPPCEEILGFRPQELVGQRLASLIHPEDLTGCQACFEALLTRPGESVVLDFRMRGKDDTWRQLSAKFTNQLDNANVRAVVVNAMKVMM